MPMVSRVVLADHDDSRCWGGPGSLVCFLHSTKSRGLFSLLEAHDHPPPPRYLTSQNPPPLPPSSPPLPQCRCRRLSPTAVSRDNNKPTPIARSKSSSPKFATTGPTSRRRRPHALPRLSLHALRRPPRRAPVSWGRGGPLRHPSMALRRPNRTTPGTTSGTRPQTTPHQTPTRTSMTRQRRRGSSARPATVGPRHRPSPAAGGESDGWKRDGRASGGSAKTTRISRYRRPHRRSHIGGIRRRRCRASAGEGEGTRGR